MNILLRLECIINSAKFVRAEFKKRQRSHQELSLTPDKKLEQFFANSIFGLGCIVSDTKALRLMCLHLTRLASVYGRNEMIPLSTSSQRNLVIKYAKGLYRYPEGKFHGIILIPMKYCEEVMKRCINGLLSQNAMFARSIRKEFEAQR